MPWQRRGRGCPDGQPPAAEIAAREDAVGEVLRYLEVGTQGLWAFFDSCLDVADVQSAVFDAIDIFTPILLGLLSYPGAPASNGGTPLPFSTKIPLTTDTDKWIFASWLSNFAVPLLSAALALDQTRHIILRKDSEAGPLLISAAGYVAESAVQPRASGSARAAGSSAPLSVTGAVDCCCRHAPGGIPW